MSQVTELGYAGLWHQRIALHQDDFDDLLYCGWRVADAQALSEMAENAGLRDRIQRGLGG